LSFFIKIWKENRILFAELKELNTYFFYQLKSMVMSKKKTSAQPTPQSHQRPVVKPNAIKSSAPKSNAAQRAREAKDARKFFMVLGIGTVVLVLFLYFIFIGRG
jgi:hypothetical protein